MLHHALLSKFLRSTRRLITDAHMHGLHPKLIGHFRICAVRTVPWAELHKVDTCRDCEL